MINCNQFCNTFAVSIDSAVFEEVKRRAWLNLSTDQQKYIDNSEPGEGLLIFENVVLPFSNPIPKNTQLYKIMTTRLSEVVEL